jgi:broad specificity phosphatase PhoE
MKSKVLELTLLRHGRSRADDEQVHDGRYDSPLTALGIEQAGRRQSPAAPDLSGKSVRVT